MWNNFAQSFMEDETISDTFCTNGIFKIWSNGSISNYPEVSGNVRNKKMIVIVDKSVILLEDENVAKCSFLGFNNQVDAVAISESGNIIVCGLASGEIYGVSIKGVILFNVNIQEEDEGADHTFTSIQQCGQHFYVVCSNGATYRINNVDETQLGVYLNASINGNESVAVDKTLMQNVVIEEISPRQRNINLSAVLLVPQLVDDSYFFFGGTNRYLQFSSKVSYTHRVKVALPEFYNGVKKCLNLDQYFIALTHSGHLLEMCPWTCLINQVSLKVNYLIDNLLVMESKSEVIELLLLTKPNGGKREMKVVRFPSLETLYELEMPVHTWLVNQPKGSFNLYYLIGSCLNKDGIPEEIEMKIVCETRPTERLSKLINKGHLEEAEEFAKLFQLSLQPLHEVKALKILNQLNDNSGDNLALENSFKELLNIMKQIESSTFIKSIRRHEMPNRHIMWTFLREISLHLDETLDEDDIQDIKEQQMRLNTLSIIDPYERIVEWQQFVHQSNILSSLTTFIKNDLPTACVIWKRHSASILLQINPPVLRNLLELIPSNTPTFHVVQWLRNFVPTISQTFPDLIVYIIEWSIQKVRSLQHLDDWPQIALEFALNAMDVFNEIIFLYADVRHQHENNVNKLLDVINVLRELLVLKKDYNINITLENYLHKSLDDRAFSILLRVHIIDFEKLLSNFLQPLYMAQGKYPLKPMQTYIQFLVRNKNNINSWLQRAVKCIELLQNETARLESALLVLQSAPVPWTNVVDPLTKLGESTHPLAKKIKIEQQIQGIRIMENKYKWKVENRHNYMKLAFRILKSNLPEMIDDINELCSILPELLNSVNFYCCYELARKGSLSKALIFFNKLGGEQKADCSEKIFNIFPEILETTTLDATSYTNLYEFFNTISSHLDASAREYSMSIKTSYTLKTEFQVPLTTSDLKRFDVRQRLLEKGIRDISEKVKTKNITTISNIWNNVYRLAVLLNFEKIEAVFQTCKLLNNIYLTCVLSYYALDLLDCTKQNAQHFIDLAVILVYQQIIFMENEFQRFLEKDCLAFPLAYKLLIKALQGGSAYPVDVTKLLQWLQVANSAYSLDAIGRLFSKEETINTWFLQYFEYKTTDGTGNHREIANKRKNAVDVFDEVCFADESLEEENELKDPEPVVACISYGLHLLVSQGFQISSFLFKKLKSYLETQIRYDYKQIKELFCNSLQILFKSKRYTFWYAIVQILLEHQEIVSEVIELQATSTHIRRILNHLLSKKEPNFIDIFNMLICDSQPDVQLYQISRKLKTDLQKENLLVLAEMYFIYTDDTEKIKSVQKRLIKQHYLSEICKQDISLSLQANADTFRLDQVMKDMQNKPIHVDILRRLSKSFGWNYQEALVLQVMAVLQSQSLCYEITTNNFGETKLVMKNCVEEMKNLCITYVNEITDTTYLTKRLYTFIQEINGYFYELYLCVMEILNHVDALSGKMDFWIAILLFLTYKMTSKRRSRPLQIETDWWLESHSNSVSLPQIAKYRLPFLPIIKYPLRDTLGNEIYVETCEEWFPLIEMVAVLKSDASQQDILGLKDCMCMIAVKNSIIQYKGNETEKWNLQPTNNCFLQSVLRLVQQVHSLSKALLILYSVASHAPEGADQVEATEACVKFALKYEKELSRDEVGAETVRKIKRKYPVMKTRHLLQSYNLIEDSTVQMIEDPMQLINLLYNDVSFIKANKLDINKICNEIAEINGLEIEGIQSNLLETWLGLKNSADDSTILEETFCDAGDYPTNVTDMTISDNAIRAYNILKNWDKKHAVQFLVQAMKPHERSGNVSKCLQLYECLSRLSNENTGVDGIFTKEKYMAIKCVHHLKQLGYTFSLDTFVKYDKISLLKKIWQNHANKATTMQVITNICLGYDIYNKHIWNGVLKQMVKFNMSEELSALVDVLSCKSTVLHTEGLIKAWEHVLKTPFKTADRQRSLAHEKLLAKVLFRLQSCPVVREINLMEIVEDCLRVERPHMAAVLIAFCCSPEEQVKIKKIITSHNLTPSVRMDILNLKDSGILPIVVDYVLKELDL